VVRNACLVGDEVFVLTGLVIVGTSTILVGSMLPVCIDIGLIVENLIGTAIGDNVCVASGVPVVGTLVTSDWGLGAGRTVNKSTGVSIGLDIDRTVGSEVERGNGEPFDIDAIGLPVIGD
jgi:hypothetical protein